MTGDWFLPEILSSGWRALQANSERQAVPLVDHEFNRVPETEQSLPEVMAEHHRWRLMRDNIWPMTKLPLSIRNVTGPQELPPLRLQISSMTGHLTRNVSPTARDAFSATIRRGRRPGPPGPSAEPARVSPPSPPAYHDPLLLTPSSITIGSPANRGAYYNTRPARDLVQEAESVEWTPSQNCRRYSVVSASVYSQPSYEVSWASQSSGTSEPATQTFLDDTRVPKGSCTQSSNQRSLGDLSRGLDQVLQSPSPSVARRSVRCIRPTSVRSSLRGLNAEPGHHSRPPSLKGWSLDSLRPIEQTSHQSSAPDLQPSSARASVMGASIRSVEPEVLTPPHQKSILSQDPAKVIAAISKDLGPLRKHNIPLAAEIQHLLDSYVSLGRAWDEVNAKVDESYVQFWARMKEKGRHAGLDESAEFFNHVSVRFQRLNRLREMILERRGELVQTIILARREEGMEFFGEAEV
jgi:hypothetical protein